MHKKNLNALKLHFLNAVLRWPSIWARTLVMGLRLARAHPDTLTGQTVNFAHTAHYIYCNHACYMC